jgi:cytochrome c biogenesis protein CcmG/thiol:disulfide interchange protein DsbE
MKLPLKFLAPAVAFAVLVVFFALQLRHGDPGRLPSALIGKPAPAFSLESLAEPARRVGSADHAGKPWLLNVWATWCAGCREEHEALMAIARTKRVPIVGLNWRDDRTLALRWLSQLGDPYVSIAYDPDGRTAIDWGVYGAPETFLIGADGTVLRKHIGPLSVAAWEREFLPLLDARRTG